MKKIITLMIFLAISSSSNPENKFLTVEIIPEDLNYFRSAVQTKPNGQKEYHDRNENPAFTEMILAFNKSAENQKSDDTKRYTVNYSNYSMIKNVGEIGKGAAFFYKQEDYLQLSNKKNLWLSEYNDLGSFTIEGRYYPIKISDNGQLFSRTGYISGKKNGINIYIKNKKIIAELVNIFYNEKNKPYSYTLSSQLLNEKHWTHFALSYDRFSGKISLLINGTEQYAVFAKDDEESEYILTPRFEKNQEPSAVIGKNIIGYLDEFRITSKNFDELKNEADIADKNHYPVNLKNRTPVNNEGVITSPIYKLNSTGSMINLINWKETLPENTFIWFEIRIADEKFDYNDYNLKWFRITNNQKNIFLVKNPDGTFLRGKYFQWRTHLIPSPDGKHSPILSDLSINYETDNNPAVPVMVKVIESGNEYTIIEWKKNVDHDILGYKIYYGVSSGKYEGIIKIINKNRISNKQLAGDKIILKIDNKTIDENHALDNSGMLSYPLLKNNVLYFFAVTAYDNYKPDTQFNHESGFSKEVRARPFGGSEIIIQQ